MATHSSILAWRIPYRRVYESCFLKDKQDAPSNYVITMGHMASAPSLLAVISSSGWPVAGDVPLLCPQGPRLDAESLVVGVVPVDRGLHCNYRPFPPLPGAVPNHLVSWKVPAEMVKGAVNKNRPK